MKMEHIYRKIAKEDGISVTEVKREMQAAIDSAYKNDRKTETEKNVQKKITYKNDIPTVAELIESLSYEIKQRTQSKKY